MLTDERVAVLEGMGVEGAKRGVSEEVRGIDHNVFSIKGIHLLDCKLK